MIPILYDKSADIKIYKIITQLILTFDRQLSFFTRIRRILMMIHSLMEISDNSLKLFRKYVFPFLSVFLLFFACTQTVKKETGILNLRYHLYEEDAPSTGFAVALIRPQIVKYHEIQEQSNSERGFFSRLITPLMEEQVDLHYFNDKFSHDYKRPVRMAITNSLQNIFIKRGFKPIGPYDSPDDLIYREKKEAYLMVFPRLDLTISRTDKKIECQWITNLCREEGSIVVGGELKLNFIEPLTKEKVITKKINLYHLYIQKDYVKEYKKRSGLIGKLLTAKRELSDTTEKALSEALNDFFRRSMGKIAAFLSRDELLSYQEEILFLKQSKAY